VRAKPAARVEVQRAVQATLAEAARDGRIPPPPAPGPTPVVVTAGPVPTTAAPEPEG
jgi:hypothetical protein